MQILAMLGMGAALLGVIGYGFVSITRTGVTASNQSLASDTLTQAKNSLITASSDSDGDSVHEAPAMYTAATNCVASRNVCPEGGSYTYPTGVPNPLGLPMGPITFTGGQLPLTMAPRVDSWGTPFGYCAWDNGSPNTSTGRNDGDSGAFNTNSSIAFAIITAGPDKKFDTSCAAIKAAVVSNNNGVVVPYAVNDDRVRFVTQAQMIQGVGGTVYYGDPVQSNCQLPGWTVLTGQTCNPAPPPATQNVNGQIRLTLDTMIPYVWVVSTDAVANPTNSPNIGKWNAAGPGAITVTAGTDCGNYPIGTLGRDVNGDLYICK